MADEQDNRVVTQHKSANRAISLAREVARTLKTVGDANLRLQRDLALAEEELRGTQLLLEGAQGDGALLEDLREAVADFGRGIIDHDELIDRAQRAHA